MQNRINLGDEVKDGVTGFQGIAVARTEWITGCDRITIQPPVDKDGKDRDPRSFDEGTVTVVKAGKFKRPEEPAPIAAKPPERAPAKRGGPRPEPQKR